MSEHLLTDEDVCDALAAELAAWLAAALKALDAVVVDTEYDGITCSECGEGPTNHTPDCAFGPLAKLVEEALNE